CAPAGAQRRVGGEGRPRERVDHRGGGGEDPCRRLCGEGPRGRRGADRRARGGRRRGEAEAQALDGLERGPRAGANLRDAAGVAVARSLVFGVGGTLAVLMLTIAVLVVRSQRRPSVVGAEGMVGAVGVARSRLAPAGTVLVRGEYWTADGDEVVDAGEPIEVTAVEGLRLRVRRARSRAVERR